MRQFFIFFIFFYNFSASFCQNKDINANIQMDLFGNLSLSTRLDNFKKDTYVIDNKILIHGEYAKLLKGLYIDGIGLIEYKPFCKKIDYVINLPKGKTSSYLKSFDFFITSINYLPIPKNDFSKKKKFNLTFDFPKKFEVIYPDKSDLDQEYTYPPPIIAGDFIKNTIHDFDVYCLKRDASRNKRILEVMEIVDDTFTFFQKSYPSVGKKPKIIFLPIEKPSAKTFENAIVFDSKILDENNQLEKRLIAHEVAHLWWGTGGLSFDNFILTEGVAEYLALKYMTNIGDTKYVENQLNAKLYHIEGNFNFKEVLNNPKKVSESFIYSYELTPLVLFDFENKGIHVFNKLVEFYKLNKNNTGKIKYLELFEYLNQNGEYNLEFNFPDFFITEKDEKIFVNCFSEQLHNVEIEFKNLENRTYRDFLIFNDTNRQYEFDSKQFNEITIDPDYKILQTSRLNDSWSSTNKSIFFKNNYFLKNIVKPEVLDKSEKFIEYFFTNSSMKINQITCESNYWLIKKLDELKLKLNDEEKKIITGASTFLRTNKDFNRIEIKINYQTDKDIKFICFYLYFDKKYEYLQDFKLIANESENFENESDEND